MQDRLVGAALGAMVGDALGMPLEFKARRPPNNLVKDMISDRLPAGTFTDDTEMALALTDSLLAHDPLDVVDLAQRFVSWMKTNPPDIGMQTRTVLEWISAGQDWQSASLRLLQTRPDSSGNESVMRCWPVALAVWRDPDRMRAATRLQSLVTHPHPDCVEACVLVNSWLVCLAQGMPLKESMHKCLQETPLEESFSRMLLEAPRTPRNALINSGWVRHTLQSAIWALLTTESFEQALIQVVNLGNDADTAGAVTGALAGAHYGLNSMGRHTTWQYIAKTRPDKSSENVKRRLNNGWY
jgi:ADP-ribosyl-[dinitrogen reductase] hydrolase